MHRIWLLDTFFYTVFWSDTSDNFFVSLMMTLTHSPFPFQTPFSFLLASDAAACRPRRRRCQTMT
jgi:hypothetical protein